MAERRDVPRGMMVASLDERERFDRELARLVAAAYARRAKMDAVDVRSAKSVQG